MRPNRKMYLATAVFLLFSLPAIARTDSLSWQVFQPVTIGTTQLKPGTYELKAEEGQSELQIRSNGHMVATIPCHWIQLSAKAPNSGIETEGSQVTQVHFSGTTAAIQFNQ